LTLPMQWLSAYLPVSFQRCASTCAYHGGGIRHTATSPPTGRRCCRIVVRPALEAVEHRDGPRDRESEVCGAPRRDFRNLRALRCVRGQARAGRSVIVLDRKDYFGRGPLRYRAGNELVPALGRRHAAGPADRLAVASVPMPSEVSDAQGVPASVDAIAPFQAKNSTRPVSKSYIAPAILIVPFDSISASTGLSLRMLAIVISTFVRATASTNV
jgi:hypothetical protein